MDYIPLMYFDVCIHKSELEMDYTLKPLKETALVEVRYRYRYVKINVTKHIQLMEGMIL